MYLPHLLLGLGIIAFFTWLNYRGIRASTQFLKATTFTFLALVIGFAIAGAKHGTASNLHPVFSHSPLISILLVWQVVPWLMSGFESVGKCAEEASPDFRGGNFSVAIIMTIFAGLTFFWVVISAVAYVAPWQSLNSGLQFPTAVAFEKALHARWIVDLILGAALVALLQAFNANMVAASRLLFAMGRRNLLSPLMSQVHVANRTPVLAICGVACATALAIFLGEAGLVPILEVGAVACAVGWMSACASYFLITLEPLDRTAAAFGFLVTLLMILVKVLPIIPGHFTRYEWLALAIWAALGLLVHAPARMSALKASDLPAETPRRIALDNFVEASYLKDYAKYSFWLETAADSLAPRPALSRLPHGRRCHSWRRIFGALDSLLPAPRESRTSSRYSRKGNCGIWGFRAKWRLVFLAVSDYARRPGGTLWSGSCSATHSRDVCLCR